MKVRHALTQSGTWLVLGAVGCGACSRPKQPGAAPAASSAHAPRLELERTPYDLGRVVQDEAVERSFAVRNRGSSPLEIRGVDPSRFCSGRVDPGTIRPGAQGELRVTCRSDLYGPLRETLAIRSNDPRLSTVELVANVTPLLAFDTPLVNLELPFGEQRSQEVRLVGTRVGEAKLKRRDEAVPDVDVDRLPADAGEAPGYRVRCRGRKPGTNAGNLVLATGLDRPPEIAIPYTCKVAGTLLVSPTNPYFDLRVSGPKVVNIDVRSSEPGFEVQAVHVTEGPFTASFERADAGAFRVKVTVLEERVDDQASTAVGKLVILSNDRTEPKKELDLFGMGRVNRGERPDPGVKPPQ
jgi:hypothetical protein